jgi:hypothetical protein
MTKQDKINAKIVAIDNAIASLRIEGLFVSQKQQQNLKAYAQGSKTFQQVLEETHQRYVVAL